MSPNPASKVKWNGNYLFGNDVLIAKPHLSSIVSAVIAGWSVTETHLGRTFATLIGAKQPVAMSMYEAVQSFQIQRELIRTAAAEVLPKTYSMIFEASLISLTMAANDRNKFAHWVWGASADPELDALFLVEPRQFWQLSIAQIKYKRKGGGVDATGTFSIAEFNAKQPKLNGEHIFVYRLTDLKNALSRIERSFMIAESLRQMVDSKGPRRRAIYRRLLSDADIQKRLAGSTKKAPPKKTSKPN